MAKRILNEEEVTTTVKKEKAPIPPKDDSPPVKKLKSAFVNLPKTQWYRVAKMSGGSKGSYVVIIDSDEDREKEMSERINFVTWLSYRMAYPF